MAKANHPLFSRRVLYGGVIILWLAVTAATFALYLSHSLQSARLHFHHIESAAYEQIAHKLVVAETVLDGFAAFHNDSQDIVPSRSRRYARQVLQRFPHIYALEVVQRVSPAEVPGLELRMRAAGFAGFRLHSRHGQAMPVQPYYYPVVFAEPLPPRFDQVMGLLVDYQQFLAPAPGLRGAAGEHRLSAPFQLLEGPMAYALTQPAGLGRRLPQDQVERQFGMPLYVSVLIKTDSLRPGGIELPQGMTMSLRHAAPDPEEGGGVLFSIGAGQRSGLESWLFPRLTLQNRLHSAVQPFVLHSEWQLGWMTLGWQMLAAISLLSVFTLLLLMLLVQRVRRFEVRRVERESELYDLAIHDPLTGLFNRYYLEKRMRREIEQHKHAHSRFGVVFIDLDRFKPINDAYGHDTGDQVLRVVAARLRNAVRQRDTVARLGGDEFVVLLEAVASHDRMQSLIAGLTEAVTQPIRLQSGVFEIGASIGIAFFPDDGESVDQLLLVADKLMYAEKQAKKVARSAVVSASS